MGLYLAVDVGGTKLRAAVYGEQDHTPIHEARIPTRNFKATPLDRLFEVIQSVWPGNERVEAIGIAAPGPVDTQRGMILEAPNISGWVNLPLRQILEERFGVPVGLGNDANLAALAEWRYGAGQGHQNQIYLTISTGVGGGVICGGNLLLGERGLAAELGHITVLPDGPLCGCGCPGHLEALSSGTAIARYVSEELAAGRESSLRKIPQPSALEINKAALAGDELALEAYQRAGKYLGLAITNFLHIFNPSIVILGGGVSRSGSLLLTTTREVIRASVFTPGYLEGLTITQAVLGDHSGLLGALALARSIQTEKA